MSDFMSATSIAGFLDAQFPSHWIPEPSRDAGGNHRSTKY
jgi:hypothetical protein